jgi:hypothetical protein
VSYVSPCTQQLELVDLSLAQSLPTTASYRHSNDGVLWVPPHRLQSAPTTSLSSLNASWSKTPLHACLPSHHRHVHLAHLPPRGTAVAMAETNSHSMASTWAAAACLHDPPNGLDRVQSAAFQKDRARACAFMNWEIDFHWECCISDFWAAVTG